MNDLGFGFAQLLVRHRAVAGAKIDGASADLSDSTTAADGLVVDRDIGVQLVIIAEPLRIHWIRKRGTGAGQSGLRERKSSQREYQKDYQGETFKQGSISSS